MPDRLVALLDTFTDWTGRCIAWLLLVMVLTTVVVVVLRYALNQSAIVLQESVMYLHAVTFMLGIPFALKEDAHVRVDLIYGRLGARSRAAIDLAGHLLFLVPVALALLLYSRTYVASAWRIMEGSPEVGGLPGVFLLKTLIPVMAVLLLLQGVAEIVRNIMILRGQHD
jgi:TRAP-type mannitol/chloroaromatic compound transport system permease small subunit